MVIDLFVVATVDLYREAQAKGLVGAEQNMKKRHIEPTNHEEEAYKQLKVSYPSYGALLGDKEALSVDI